MTFLVEKRLRRVWDKARQVYEYVLKASPHICSR